MTIFNAKVLLEQGIQIYVHIPGVARVLLQLAVRDLSVINLLTMDSVLTHQSTGILAEIVEDFDNIGVFEYLFQTVDKGVKFNQVKDPAVTAQPNLYLG